MLRLRHVLPLAATAALAAAGSARAGEPPIAPDTPVTAACTLAGGPSAEITGRSGAVRDTPEAFASPGQAGVIYTWSTDDGAAAAGATFSHTWTTTGSHAVTLTATRADGCSAATTQPVTVVAPASAPTGGGGAGAPVDGLPPVSGPVGPDPVTDEQAVLGERDAAAPTVRLVAVSRTSLRVRVSGPAALTATLCPHAHTCVRRTRTVWRGGTVTLKGALPHGVVAVVVSVVDERGKTGTLRVRRTLR